MTPPKFDNMSRLLPGVYVDRYRMEMRLDMGELLRANGRDDTPENRAELRETARQMADIMGARLEDQ
jgi:hypothetical protein